MQSIEDTLKLLDGIKKLGALRFKQGDLEIEFAPPDVELIRHDIPRGKYTLDEEGMSPEELVAQREKDLTWSAQ